MDNLLIASKSLKIIVVTLTSKHDFKLKGVGPITYHLGCDFTRDGNNELCLAFLKCIDKISDSRVSIFSSKPKPSHHSPLEKGDHPELDTKNFLDSDGI